MTMVHISIETVQDGPLKVPSLFLDAWAERRAKTRKWKP
jgi:hypothetical protein